MLLPLCQWRTPEELGQITRIYLLHMASIHSPNLVKSRSREIGFYNDRIMIVSLWNLTGNSAADVPVKFQSDWKRLNPNIYEIVR